MFLIYQGLSDKTIKIFLLRIKIRCTFNSSDGDQES